MYQGKLNKARRGALLGVPPLGYIRLATGEWAIGPDERVQATVRLILDRFDRETTLHGLLRYPVHHEIRIPVRSDSGPNRGELEWRRPSRTTLSNLLHHPSYAGAYRLGHRPVDPRRKQPGRQATGKKIRRPEDCLVPIRDRLPAYISWDRFRANQERLEANRARQDRPGAPRQGHSLLAGLLHCGRCGRRMIVLYSGPKDPHAYTCTRGPTGHGEPPCQGPSGPAVDDLVAGRLLAAVEPAALEASLAAVTGVGRGRAELTRHWRLRRERADHEVDRAARQYQACEPEKRLVGRELERRWEGSPKGRRQLEDEYERWQRTAPGRLSPGDEQAIRSLAGDLPAVWRAATTTPPQRQRIARLLVERVSVVVDKASGRVDVELHWAGGPVESHMLSRPVRRYELRSDYPRMVGRMRTWCSEGLSTAEIADRLNEEGFRPPKRADRLDRGRVQRLLCRLEPTHGKPHGSPPGLGPDEYRPGGLARRPEIAPDTVRRWIRAGWVTSSRDAGGHHVIWADASELARLRQLHARPRTWATKGRLVEWSKPEARPER